jgi:hypothetical protein
MAISLGDLKRINLPTEGPPATIAKLVHITPITMVYGTQITIVMGVYKPTYNWGAPHCTHWSNSFPKREPTKMATAKRRSVSALSQQNGHSLPAKLVEGCSCLTNHDQDPSRDTWCMTCFVPALFQGLIIWEFASHCLWKKTKICMMLHILIHHVWHPMLKKLHLYGLPRVKSNQPCT